MQVAGIDVDALIDARVLAEYRERGYWRSPRLFDAQTTARLRRAHRRLWAGDFDHPIASQYGPPGEESDRAAVRQQCNAFWLNDDIRAVTTSPLLGAIGARLMGVAEVRLWHDQAVKKPGAGAAGGAVTAGNIGWHQDYGHWQCSSSTDMCTAWVALQDTDLGNGAMRTVVGSHRWGLLEESDNFGKKDLEGLRARLSTQPISGAWIDEPCVLREGEVSFHHCLTLHGSGPNLSGAARLCVISHMMPGDTSYRPSPQHHPNLVFLGPDARPGQRFAGPWWPVMWPPVATPGQRTQPG